MSDLFSDRNNQIRSQHKLVLVLSSISPFAALSQSTMDLARTGHFAHEQIEDALAHNRRELSRFVLEQKRTNRGSYWYSGGRGRGFPVFSYESKETWRECLARNAGPIANLALLAILGFAGAYVAMLRYDVR